MPRNNSTETLNSEFYPVIDGIIQPRSTLDTALKEYQFPNTPPWQQAILASDPYCDSAVKQYVAVRDISGVIAHLSAADAHLYELLPEGRPVRPYFDIEYDAEQLVDTVVLETILDAIAVCLRRIGCTGSRGIAVYTASGACSPSKIASGKKASFHLICDTYEVFSSVADHRRFVKDVLFPYLRSDKGAFDSLHWIDPTGAMKCALDAVPYKTNQTFRLPYQSKHSSSAPRCLVPYDVSRLGCDPSEVYTVGVYEDPSALTFLRVPESTTAAMSKKRVGVMGPSEGVESPEFPKVAALCECLSAPLLQDYETAEHLIYLLCGVECSPRMRELIHRTCARATNYEWKWVQGLIESFRFVGIFIGTLVKWAIESVGKEAVVAILNTFSVPYYKELFHTTMRPPRQVTIHERYLGGSVRLDGGTTTLLIKSHLGTGKTTAISRLMSAGCYDRVLIVSPRKSYTYAIHASLEEDAAIPTFASYLDHAGPLSGVDRVIVQVESLHRVGEWFIPYDLVILDESESILNQLHSVLTHGEHLINNHQVLELVMRTAKHVVCADAFLSDRTFHFAKQLREEAKTLYIENTYNPYEREAIQLVGAGDPPLEVFCERIMGALLSGKKVVVLWTSKRVGEEFVEHYLAKESFAYKFYHSESTKEDQEALRDVHTAWGDLRCLMYTTSITVGLSFDPQMAGIEFDEAFLYGTYLTALPRDIAQSLLRVRVLKENRLTYVLNTPRYVDDGGGVHGGFVHVAQQLEAKESGMVRAHPLAKWVLAPEWVRWNHVFNENEERISRSEYRAVLEEYLIGSGYALRTEACSVEAVEAVEVKTEVEDRRLWDVIPDVSRGDAEKLYSVIKRGEATAEDKLAYRKYEFRGQFVVGVDEAFMGSLWNEYMLSDSMDRFWNVVAEKRWSVGDLASAEAKKRYAIMSGGRVKKRETMDRFLGMVGMNHSMERVTLGAERLVEIGPRLEAMEKELREGLGLRGSQRKTKEWKVSNTIDLIQVILGEWCGANVEREVIKIQKNKKRITQYTLEINKNGTFWDKIKTHDVDDSKLLIRF